MDIKQHKQMTTHTGFPIGTEYSTFVPRSCRADIETPAYTFTRKALACEIYPEASSGPDPITSAEDLFSAMFS